MAGAVVGRMAYGLHRHLAQDSGGWQGHSAGKGELALHLHVVIPTLGAILSGARDAYTYLPASTEQFLSADERAHIWQSSAGPRPEIVFP